MKPSGETSIKCGTSLELRKDGPSSYSIEQGGISAGMKIPDKAANALTSFSEPHFILWWTSEENYSGGILCTNRLKC